MSTESLGPETIFSFGKYKGQTFIYVYDNDAKYVNWVKSLPDPSGKMLEFLNFVNEHEMCKNLNTNVKYTNIKQNKLDKSFEISPKTDIDITSPNKLTLESSFIKRRESQSPIKLDIDNKRIKKNENPTPGDNTYLKEDLDKEKEQLSPSLQHMLKVLEMDNMEQKLDNSIMIEGCLALVLFSEDEFYLSYTKSKDNTGWWSCYIPSEIFSAISNMGITLNTRLVGKQKYITFKAEDYNNVLKGLRGVVKNKSRIESVPNFILRSFPEFRIFSRELEIADKTKEVLQGIQDEYTIRNKDNMKRMIGDDLWEKLLPFQKQGVLFGLDKNGRVLIGDEMGLGKTLQALAISAFYQEDWPLLIICPSSIRFQWVEQCITWLPHLVVEDEVFLVKTSKSLYDLCKNINDKEQEDDNWNLEELKEGFEGKKDEFVIRGSDLNDKSIKIVVISYDLVVRIKNLKDFKVIICDESHYLKNRTSQRSRRIVPMLKEAKRTILLSGTPAVNNPSELFEQLSSIIPGFASYNIFVERYCNKRLNYYTKKMDYSGSKHSRELHLFLIRTIMIRRLKDEVMKELPPKIRSKIPIEISERVLKATKLFFDEYKEINQSQSQTQSQSQETIDNYLTTVNVNNNKLELVPQQQQQVQVQQQEQEQQQRLLLRQEQLLLQLEQQQQQQHNELKGISMTQELFMLTGRAKIKGVCNYVEEILESENKFIIFAHHIFMLDAIEETLKNKRINYIRIDGSTSINERSKLVQLFQSTHTNSSPHMDIQEDTSTNEDRSTSTNLNEDTSPKPHIDIQYEQQQLEHQQEHNIKNKNMEVRVALLSLTACGVGLNLTSSSTVIFAELFWSPSKLLQAEDRVHRIGTKANTINIHYLIAQNSIDDLIWKIINNKQMNLTATLDGNMTNISISTSKKKDAKQTTLTQ